MSGFTPRGGAAAGERVYVVEDDIDAACFVGLTLERAGYDVTIFAHPEHALAALEREACAVLLSDVRLPGMTGLELLTQARRCRPGLAVVLMTAFATLDDTIFALRNGADEFLLKPLTVDGLSTRIAEVLEGKQSGRERVLAIGAHPDDVEIGVGGTLAGHIEQGDHVTILTLSQGESGGPALDRMVESEQAAKALGAELIMGDLPDTNLSPSGRTVSLIEDAVRCTNATIVYTHSQHDVHQDHRAAHQASLVGCRSVPQVFAYQSPSATVDFAPRRFVPIDEAIDRKLAAIAAYRSQTTKCAYLAEDLLRSTARYWGRFVQSDHAEPFEIIREQTRPIHDSTPTRNSTTTEEVDNHARNTLSPV